MNTLHKAALAAAVGLLSAQVAQAQTQPTDSRAQSPSNAAPRSDTTGTPRNDVTDTPRNPASGTTPSTSPSGATDSSSRRLPATDRSPSAGPSASSDSGASSGTMRASSLSDQDTVSITEMNDTAARAIQTKLQQLGLYQGEIDGIVGPQTKRALREFYRAQADLVSEGKLLADSASLFDLSASDIQPVRGQNEPSTGSSLQGTSSSTQTDSSMQGTTGGTRHPQRSTGPTTGGTSGANPGNTNATQSGPTPGATTPGNVPPPGTSR